MPTRSSRSSRPPTTTTTSHTRTLSLTRAEPDKPEEAVAEEATAGDEAGAWWSGLAAKLPVGDAGAAARDALFAQLDRDADGSLTLMELEDGLPAALEAPGVGGVLSTAITTAFEGVKNLGDLSRTDAVMLADNVANPDDFEMLAAYLHACFTLYATLSVPCDASALPTLDPAKLEVLAAAPPPSWQLDPAEATEAFCAMDGWSSGSVRAEDAIHWMVMRALPQLTPVAASRSHNPRAQRRLLPSRRRGGGDGEDDDEEAEAVEGDDGDETGADGAMLDDDDDDGMIAAPRRAASSQCSSRRSARPSQRRSR